MSKKPTQNAPSQGAADAAAAFADGHVAPVAPTAGFVAPLESEFTRVEREFLPDDGAAAGLDAQLAASDALATMRQNERVSLTKDVLADTGAPAYLLIVCGTPSFRRGGIMHPSRAEYPLDAFTQEQLDAFIAEPRLEMVSVGGEPVARATRLFGAELAPALPRDPLLAGQAAAAAISDPPNRAAPGLRNNVAGPAGFSAR